MGCNSLLFFTIILFLWTSCGDIYINPGNMMHSSPTPDQELPLNPTPQNVRTLSYAEYPLPINFKETAGLRRPNGKGAGSFKDLIINGDYLYLLTDQSLKIFNIMINIPQFLDDLEITSFYTGMSIHKNKLYIISYNSLFIYDISAPQSAPVLMGEYSSQKMIRRISVQGLYAFIEMWESARKTYSQVLVLDISNPEAITEVITYDVSSNICSLETRSSHLFIGSDDNLKIVDFSDPQNPVQVLCYETSSLVESISLSGDIVYLAIAGNLLEVLDITEMNQPRSINTLNLKMGITGLQVFDDFLYIYGDDLLIMNCYDPRNIKELGKFSEPSSIIALALKDDLLYIADTVNNFYVLEIDNPSSPKLLQNLDILGRSKGIQVFGDYVYIADDYGGMKVIEISSNTVELISNFKYHVCLDSIKLFDHYAVPKAVFDILFIDVKTPSAPHFQSMLHTDWNIHIPNFSISNNQLFALTYHKTLQSYSIEIPSEWRYIGQYQLPFFPQFLETIDRYAIVGSNSTATSLLILDGSDSVIKPVAQWNTGMELFSMIIHKNYLYVFFEYGHLAVIDIRTPEKAEWNSTFTTGRSYIGTKFSAEGNKLVISNGNVIQVLDVSLPYSPTLMGEYFLDSSTYIADITLQANRIYLAMDSAAEYFRIIDLVKNSDN